MPITISMNNPEVNQGDAVTFIAGGDVQGKPPQSVTWAVVDAAGNELGEWIVRDAPESDWRAVGVEPGVHFVRATAKAGRTTEETTERIYVRTRAIVIEGHLDSPVRVDLQRAAVPRTTDLALWEVIRRSTEAISFDHYSLWMDYLFCDGELPSAFHPGRDRSKELSADGLGSRWHAGQAQFRNGGVHRAPLPFPDIDGYKVLKAATETFLEFNSGVVFDEPVVAQMHGLSEADRKHLGLDSSDNLQSLWGKYLIRVGDVGFIPYLYRVRQKLHDVQLTTNRLEGELCDKILETKFTNPFLLELIWSYWHEEGMLVETMNAISRRFQNRHGPREADPLANLTIGPLRPLSNLLWGYVQDEQHRLTPDRIGYEYKQNYGVTPVTHSMRRSRAADTRSGFLPAFHNLLHRASIFYRDDDDTTIIADAFPVLQALRDVHLVLAESADNQQYGVTWNARSEMLIQQWLLARPEFREFLPTRPMVVYPEPWMDRVDAMKRIQGWTDTSIRHFRDLAVFGEQLLLSIRYGDWSNVTDREQAANWCRSWRDRLHGYVYAYECVTRVDLSAEVADVRLAEQARARALPPAYHLQRRLIEQRHAGGAQARQLQRPTR